MKSIYEWQAERMDEQEDLYYNPNRFNVSGYKTRQSNLQKVVEPKLAKLQSPNMAGSYIQQNIVNVLDANKNEDGTPGAGPALVRRLVNNIISRWKKANNIPLDAEDNA